MAGDIQCPYCGGPALRSDTGAPHRCPGSDAAMRGPNTSAPPFDQPVYGLTDRIAELEAEVEQLRGRTTKAMETLDLALHNCRDEGISDLICEAYVALEPEEAAEEG